MKKPKRAAKRNKPRGKGNNSKGGRPKKYKPDKTERKQTKRRAPRTAWKPGQSGNPLGRPKGTKERDCMLEAKAEVEEAKKKSIYQHAFERAFEDDRVLIAMLKKLVPDMAYIEAEAAESLVDIIAIMMEKDGSKS